MFVRELVAILGSLLHYKYFSMMLHGKYLLGYMYPICRNVIAVALCPTYNITLTWSMFGNLVCFKAALMNIFILRMDQMTMCHVKRHSSYEEQIIINCSSPQLYGAF